MDYLKQKIRTIPDFPKSGILFRDITTLLADPEAFKSVIDLFIEHYRKEQIDLVVGIATALALNPPTGAAPIETVGVDV